MGSIPTGKANFDNANLRALWYKRLVTYLEIELSDFVSDGILDSIDFTDFNVCLECIKAKQSKSKRLGAYKAMNVLKLIHTDICGSFPIWSWNDQ